MKPSQVVNLQKFWVQFGLLWVSQGPGRHFTASSFGGYLFNLADVLLFNFAQASWFWIPSPKISATTRNPRKSTMKPATDNHPTPKIHPKAFKPQDPIKTPQPPKIPPTPSRFLQS